MASLDQVREAIQRANELHSTATPGPWRADKDCVWCLEGECLGEHCDHALYDHFVFTDDCSREENCTFIAESRSLLPRFAKALDAVLDSIAHPGTGTVSPDGEILDAACSVEDLERAIVEAFGA